MRSRMMVSMLVIALAAAMVGGATMAWFTDKASVEGNVFSAGTLVVDLDGSAPLTIENMAPGDSGETMLIVKNTGSLDMLFRVYVDNVVSTPGTPPQGGTGKNLEGVLDVVVTLRPEGAGTYGPPGGETVFTGKLNQLIGATNAKDNVSAAFDDGWPLKPSLEAHYLIQVSMPTSAGNEYQGASFSGTLVVEATQFANQARGTIGWQ